MHITVYQGAPGSRKTLTFLDEALDTPGLYLVAFPRNALIDEQADYCRKKLGQVGAGPVVPIHTAQPHHHGQVGRRIEEALEANAGQHHVVMMISHAALLGLDPALLAGWHVAIDENIDNSVASGTFKASTSWSVLERHFRLDPLPGGQTWEVVPRDDVAPLTRKAITAEGKNGLSAFLTYASQPRRSVFVDAGDWRDAQLGRPVRWWSIWSPLVLNRCAAVTLIGAGYFESIPHHASEWLSPGGIAYTVEDLSASVRRASPRVRIHYYTRGHVGSTAWWETDDGIACLVQVSDHQKLIGGPGYWSSNEAIRLAFCQRFPGEWCSPKQAGTNGLIRHTSCLYIYSAKPQMDDAPIVDLLGIGRDVIRHAREFEDIRQFALRGALRRPDYAGAYDIYLYDLVQAQDLEAYLRGIGIADLELVPVVEAGIMDVVRPGSVAVALKAPLSREEKRERNTASQQKRRDKVRAEEEAQGIKRKIGRPRKPPVDHEAVAP